MQYVIFNLLWLDAVTDIEPDLCRQVLALFYLHYSTSSMPQASFTTFREDEVQDWDQIGYFVPRFNTFYHVLRGRSTGLGLKLVLRARNSHVLPRFERTKYRIGTEFGTSRRDFTRFTTF